MSRTTMTEIMIRNTVVMTLRKRGRTRGPFSGGASGTASGHARHEERLPGAACLGFGQRPAGRDDHAPGALERAFAEFEAEQPVALERARQRQLSGLGG